MKNMTKKISLAILMVFIFSIFAVAAPAEVRVAARAEAPGQLKSLEVREQVREKQAYLVEMQTVRRMVAAISDKEEKQRYHEEVKAIHASKEAYGEKIKKLNTMEKNILKLLQEQVKNDGREQLLQRLDRFRTLEEQKQLTLEEKNRLRERELKDRIFVRGMNLKFDVPPVIKEGRTLVPVRAITEGLGAEVVWNEAKKTITITKGDKVIVLKMDSREITVNGEPYLLDVPAQMNENRTFVPLRFISEILGVKVDYNTLTGDIDLDDDELEDVEIEDVEDEEDDE